MMRQPPIIFSPDFLDHCLDLTLNTTPHSIPIEVLKAYREKREVTLKLGSGTVPMEDGIADLFIQLTQLSTIVGTARVERRIREKMAEITAERIQRQKLTGPAHE